MIKILCSVKLYTKELSESWEAQDTKSKSHTTKQNVLLLVNDQDVYHKFYLCGLNKHYNKYSNFQKIEYTR